MPNLVSDVLSPETIEIVRVLEAQPMSLNRPIDLDPSSWGPWLDGGATEARPLAHRFPDGMRSVMAALDVETQSTLYLRLCNFGVLPSIIRPAIPDAREPSRADLLLAENTRIRRGRPPTIRQIMRNRSQATFANAWIDIFRTVALVEANDGRSLIRSFIKAWHSLLHLIGDPEDRFDINDAWLFARADTDGELSIARCRSTNSSYIQIIGDEDRRSPWIARRPDALPLRRRVLVFIVANEIATKTQNIDEIEAASIDITNTRSRQRASRRQTQE